MLGYSYTLTQSAAVPARKVDARELNGCLTVLPLAPTVGFSPPEAMAVVTPAPRTTAEAATAACCARRKVLTKEDMVES